MAKPKNQEAPKHEANLGRDQPSELLDAVSVEKRYELKGNRIFIPGIGTVEAKDFTNDHYNFIVKEYGEAAALKIVK